MILSINKKTDLAARCTYHGYFPAFLKGNECIVVESADIPLDAPPKYVFYIIDDLNGILRMMKGDPLLKEVFIEYGKSYHFRSTLDTRELA
jgi:hypothetical protein